MENDVKQKAEALLENGEVEALYELLSPLLEKNDAYAQFLYSSFSLESTGETDDEFEARSMKLLGSASEGGVAEASYRLAVIYLYGDFVDNNSKSSSDYFERAIAQGHSHSKFTYFYYVVTCYSNAAFSLLLSLWPRTIAQPDRVLQPQRVANKTYNGNLSLKFAEIFKEFRI